MAPRDHFAELGSAVASYLHALAAVAECVGDACPEVGEPYRERIHRLRARLSFDATRDSIKDSSRALDIELRDYAEATVRYLDQHEIELRRSILTLQEVIESTARDYDDHGVELQKVADDLDAEAGTLPSFEEFETPQSRALRERVRLMNVQTAGMLSRMREEIDAVETRLAGAQSTDPSTGLINRREMARQIEAYEAGEIPFCLLRFGLRGAIGEQVMQQAAQRLVSSFRHRDRVARWGTTEFLVLFQGPADVGRSRAAEIASGLKYYSLDTGVHVEAVVDMELTHEELASVRF